MAYAIGIVLALVVAVLGFRSNLWWAVVGLAGHGVFDALHGFVVTNPGVPEWWPAFCLSFDVGAAGFLAWLLLRSQKDLGVSALPLARLRQ